MHVLDWRLKDERQVQLFKWTKAPNQLAGEFTSWDEYYLPGKYDIMSVDHAAGDTAYIASTSNGKIAAPFEATISGFFDMVHTMSASCKPLVRYNETTGWVLDNHGALWFTNDCFSTVNADGIQNIQYIFISADRKAIFAVSNASGGLRKLYKY